MTRYTLTSKLGDGHTLTVNADSVMDFGNKITAVTTFSVDFTSLVTLDSTLVPAELFDNSVEPDLVAVHKLAAANIKYQRATEDGVQRNYIENTGSSSRVLCFTRAQVPCLLIVTPAELSDSAAVTFSKHGVPYEPSVGEKVTASTMRMLPGAKLYL